ncbi:substrate-binding domain-containing protein [Streptomyces johnsoniae]|uniref:Substrate-binding domain-containing protein n=1 Tax=Streptomyces johnsoniae TaxID=3075532 RepID=A0ABU2S255_9ACTN|nr:substrate-binding domain-containing protein [Streptomyces sp. DSM 41886]MDT0443020.1 substrate-binding domain-containing protein [Streptomyces sp. DSM 41886]
MREPVDVRRQRILAAVQSHGVARLADLASELDVSVVTIRRDVEELARAGKLRRGHGVARSAAPPKEEPAAPSGPPAGGGAIALVVPERHGYLYETLHGARPVLEEAGMRIALHIAPSAAHSEQPIVERAVAGGAAGLLIAPRWRSVAAEEAGCRWLSRVAVPTVLMERRPRPGSVLHAVDSVCSDHWYGVHLAVDHLVSLGHRRIVLAARDDSPSARAIRAAFADIAAGHPLVEDWSVALSSPNAVPERDGGHGAGQAEAEAAVDLAALLRQRGATAAVLHSDVDALMLVQQLTDSGVRVPRDCSVVAYDDVVAALAGPPLTAVAPPKAEIGRLAAELLLLRLAANRQAAGPVRRVELLPELMVRGSAVPHPAAGMTD